ncbi:hypothetical protein [Rhodococcoides fascians]|uniref:hypothetical protein n=1 Tax=Rhodococcoides fascians TaxID=1828 RepID=UPI0012D31DF9|nr:hypothetical protein [Rhodococcus fascians]
MNLVTGFAVAQLGSKVLPKMLPSLGKPIDFRGLVRPADNLLILASTDVWGAAIDLDTRLMETGLAPVQTTDYRNFAHGRHLGLSRNRDKTTVISLSDASTHLLAIKTTDLLPANVPVIRLSSGLTESVACLDLLGHTMRLFGVIAADASVDAARPSVPDFGRQLYNLKSGRAESPVADTSAAVTRKLEAASLPLDATYVGKYTRALNRWVRVAGKTSISGLLLDYDGTVCTTTDRFDPPELRVQTEIVRLLGMGLHVGFASGRGKSLPVGLSDWIPSEYFDQVHIGMYNGAIRGCLSDGPVIPSEGPFSSTKTKALRKSLASRLSGIGGELTYRPFQISVTQDEAGMLPAFATAVSEVIAAHNLVSEVKVKSVLSAHSVDIILSSTSKNQLRSDVEDCSGLSGVALSVGDQGGLGGNDYEMLSATNLSLSVDDVSGDPTRCWNLEAGSRRGPEALVKYLGSVRRDRSRLVAFRSARFLDKI